MTKLNLKRDHLRLMQKLGTFNDSLKHKIYQGLPTSLSLCSVKLKDPALGEQKDDVLKHKYLPGTC